MHTTLKYPCITKKKYKELMLKLRIPFSILVKVILMTIIRSMKNQLR